MAIHDGWLVESSGPAAAGSPGEKLFEGNAWWEVILPSLTARSREIAAEVRERLSAPVRNSSELIVWGRHLGVLNRRAASLALKGLSRESRGLRLGGNPLFFDENPPRGFMEWER